MNIVTREKSLILKTIHKLKTMKQVTAIFKILDIPKDLLIIFSKNKIKPFKNPHKMKLRLAPCHKPAIDITNVRLKNSFFLDFFDPPRGIYK